MGGECSHHSIRHCFIINLPISNRLLFVVIVTQGKGTNDDVILSCCLHYCEENFVNRLATGMGAKPFFGNIWLQKFCGSNQTDDFWMVIKLELIYLINFKLMEYEIVIGRLLFVFPFNLY